MITSSTNVARGGLSNPEARISSRAETGADFREEVSRERVRERSTERARSADDVRGERPEREVGVVDEDETVTAADDTPADGSPDPREDRVAPEARAATDDAPAARDAARTAASVGSEVEEGAKTGTPPRSAPTESAAVPAVLPTLVAPPTATPEIAPNTIPTPRAPADSDATPQPEDEGVAAVGTPAAKPVASAPAAAADTIAIPPEALEHDAATHELLEVAREVRPSTSSDAGSNAQALAARGPTSIADVATSAPAAPLAATRLTPAELPLFLEHLQVSVDGAARSAFVELEPLALGRLTVELSIQSEGGVRADVRAERPDGYAAIEARLPELRASLIDRGFATADVQISLGLAQRDARREGGDTEPRRARRDQSRTLDTERVLALAPNRTGSIDLWA